MTIIIRIIGVLMCLMGCIGLWETVPVFFRFLIYIFDDPFIAIAMAITYGLLFTIYGLMAVVSIGVVRLIPRSIRLAIPVLLAASISDVLIALAMKFVMNNATFILCSNPTFLRGFYISWILLLIAACICLLFTVILWVYKKRQLNKEYLLSCNVMQKR